MKELTTLAKKISVIDAWQGPKCAHDLTYDTIFSLMNNVIHIYAEYVDQFAFAETHSFP